MSQADNETQASETKCAEACWTNYTRRKAPWEATTSLVIPRSKMTFRLLDRGIQPILSFPHRNCVAIEKSAVKVVIPAQAGIQTESRRRTGISLKLLDSPVSSMGQALRRALLARNDKNELRHCLAGGNPVSLYHYGELKP